MKLLFIRHGDPDYSVDSLTEKGWKEAEYLAERMAGTDIQYFYVSPLGRARDTASLTLKRLGREAVELPWLREFTAPIWRPDERSQMHVTWDWLPQDWTADDRFYSFERWTDSEWMAGVRDEYDRVTGAFDELLERHGYRRENRYYRVTNGNKDTLAFFCHFGVECVMLSRLLSVSPMPLWHGLCAAPTSVTTVVTEERREGIAAFRVTEFGDVSHLRAHGEPPAFAGRFREIYADEDNRTF